MSVEVNKELVRRFVDEFWNAGNMAAADELMTRDARISLPGRGPVDKEGFKQFASLMRRAFPDWHATVDRMVAEGDTVGEWWTGRGTHKGEFQGLAPTEKQVAVPGVVFYRIESGKIAEFDGTFDSLGMMRQLGTL